MTDSAAALLGGDAAPPASPPASPPAAAAPPVAPPAGGGDWLSGLDADNRAWAEGKGFKDGAAAALAYRNLEKVMGGDKLPKPKGDDDAAGWDATYKALGRPDKPDDYKLPVPDGQDGALAKEFAPAFHKLGLSQKQAAGLVEHWNAHTAKLQADADASQATANEAAMVELKRDWGGQYDANVEAGRRAARQFGLNADSIGKIEAGLGTAETIKLMTKLGLALGEDSGVPHGAGGGQAFASTKEQAQHQIGQKKLDKTFMDSYLNKSDPGHATAVAEFTRLHQIAAG